MSLLNKQETFVSFMIQPLYNYSDILKSFHVSTLFYSSINIIINIIVL